MALTTLNLSGIKAGDSLQVSVSQGGLTAGPYSIGSWGGTTGTVNIVVPYRSTSQMAPDSVRMKVDITGAGFDTQAGPVDAGGYDPSYHDLIYFWDFDDARQWTAPQKIFDLWKDGSKTKGPQVVRLYAEPGSYSPTVMVYEPSSGKVATGTVSAPIVVGSRDDFYDDDATYYVRPVGDTDESWIPAGVPASNRIEADSLRKLRMQVPTSSHPDSNWIKGHWDETFPLTTKPVRWRFKRGGTYQVTLYMDGYDIAPITFEDYGDPNEPDPILTTPENPVPNSFDLQMFFFGYGHGQFEEVGDAPEHRYINLDCRGRFDPAVSEARLYEGESSGCMGGSANKAHHWIIVHNCSISGFGVTNIAPLHNASVSDDTDAVFHLDNCVLENFGGQYPIISTGGWGPNGRHHFAVTGCRFTAKPDGFALGVRACVRVDHSSFIFLAGNDMFNTERLFAAFDMMKTPKQDGDLVVAYGNATEAGAAIGLAGNDSQSPRKGAYVINAVIDSWIHTACNEFQMFGRYVCTGMTLRNILWIVPDKVNINGVTCFASLCGYDGGDSSYYIPVGTTTPDYVWDAPVRFENITWRVDQDTNAGLNQTAMRPFLDPAPVTRLDRFADIQISDLHIHAPDKSPAIDGGPLVDTVLWTPRNTGCRFNPGDPLAADDPPEFETAYATPVDAIRLTQPAPGSSAIGTATGSGSVKDALGANFKGDKGWLQSA